MQIDDESWKDLPVRPNSDPHYPLPLSSGEERGETGVFAGQGEDTVWRFSAF